MDARYKEPGRLEELHRARADQRDVEIARPGAVGVERRIVLPTPAGDGAVSQNRGPPRWPRAFDRPAKRVEQLAPAAKCKRDDVVPLLLLCESALNIVGSNRVSHNFRHLKLPSFCLERSNQGATQTHQQSP